MAHAKPGKFKCDKCKFSCCTKPTLNGHKIKKHEPIKHTKRPVVTFQCEECISTFHTNTKLKLHQRTEHMGQEKTETVSTSPPVSPEHKKMKENVGDETEDKNDEAKEAVIDVESQNVEVSRPFLNGLTGRIHTVEKENVLLKQRLTDWQVYGEDLLNKYNATKTNLSKLEVENEKLGLKYINTVKELSEYKDVVMEEYSINVEEGEDPEKQVQETSNKKEGTKNSNQHPDYLEKFDELECGECNYKARDKDDLMRHFAQPSCNIELYFCRESEHCYSASSKLGFRTEEELKNHISEVHKTESDEKEPPFSCPDCNFPFIRSIFKSDLELQEEFKAHQKSAHSENVVPKDFPCTDCNDFIAPSEEALKSHKKYSCKDFHCMECDYQSNTEEALVNHMKETHHKIQSPPRQKNCYTCKEVFNNTKDLMKHRKETHPSTDVCKYFKTDRGCKWGDECLYVHIEEMVVGNAPTPVHTSPSPPSPLPPPSNTPQLTCRNCGEAFNSKHNLMSHRKQAHVANVRPCRDFQQNNCRRGEARCWYKHDNNQQASTQHQQQQQTQNAQNSRNAQNFQKNQQVNATPDQTNQVTLQQILQMFCQFVQSQAQ